MVEKKLSSRERMMAAIECQEPDYVPLCFMIFSALKNRCKNKYEFVDKQLELGLDAVLDLPVTPPPTQSEHSDLYGLPAQFDPRVQVNKAWVRCQCCGQPVSRANLVDPAKRAWVAKRPGVEKHSYYV